MSIVRRIFSVLSALADGVCRDGLDMREYEARLEREFQVTLPPDQASELKTLGDLCRLIAEERKRTGLPVDSDEIWRRVRVITAEEMGVNASELSPGTRFVEDLCF